MKIKQYYLIYIMTGLLGLQACHDKLDVNQKSAITADAMWADEGDAVAAMYGIYNEMRSSFSDGYAFWGEYRSGLWGGGLATNATYSDPFTNQLTSTHTHANWKNLYTTINDCNLILKYTPDISFANEVDKNKVLANALFVRAFCYYWIGRIWGDAPVLLNGFESGGQEDLYPSRDPADRVFDQVGIDLETANSLMPESVTDRDLASKAAINLLQADYYLWMAKVRGGGMEALNMAKQVVDAVLSNSNYALMSDFSSVFSSELNQEIVFAWSYVMDEYTGGYPADYLVPLQYISTQYIENPIKVGSHQQWIFLTNAYKSFLSENEDDQRTNVSFETFFDAPKDATFQWINKYAGSWQNQTRVFDADIVVYRYADALLMSAEIENALDNSPLAIERLNAVAERAYGTADFYSAALSPDQIDREILNERKREFVAEGKIWWDLIRFGVVFDEVPSLVGRENEQNILLWPVHNTSINTNPNIIQTPGY
ncbi:RagB/SusD family nutrient uptake outer membrane protein [Parapedobacter tibetensis]|uniref:RagB/SusD family nutrient uptake outer membrane protein n=1 Tax=Parapedobacter tibetensis TaxID=2972951 RepID=UPI00214D4E56|nr:RagB/SusD family nutrient uptake outer membrane protein [Parapedobacter tibetensis]